MQEKKQLVRSQEERIITGVAGGLGRYFSIDPVFIRFLFVLLVFANGIGIIAYLVLWVLMPHEGSASSSTQTRTQENLQEMQQKLRGVVQWIRGIFQ